MVSVIPILSNVPNLLHELTRTLPLVKFHKVLDADNDPHFKNSEIIISDFDLLAKHVYSLPKVKWVQGTWAGTDSLMSHIKASNPPSYQITRFSGEHFGRMMAEYVVTCIVNYERTLFRVKENQEKQFWNQEGKIKDYRTIFDLTIGIFGLGNIGTRVAKTLNSLGADVLAFGRNSSLPINHELEWIKRYYSKETLVPFLQECDYIINTLPKTKETDGLLENNVLENCLDKATIFINVGRSNIISEKSLIKALNEKWLSATILDVFDEEPLPKESPLWTMDQVIITPHVSAVSRAKDIASLFQSNFLLYQQKRRLPSLIDFSKGY